MTKLEELARAVEAKALTMSKFSKASHLTEAMVLAVLEALKEPSEGMAEAAWCPDGCGNYRLKEIFTAMIQHIIDEHEGPPANRTHQGDDD